MTGIIQNIFLVEKLWSQTKQKNMGSEGKHPKYRFWTENTLGAEHHWGPLKVNKTTKMLILIGKYVGGKQHWEPILSEGTTQNINTE